MMRIGSGYDSHCFGPGDHVMLAGVRIAHTHGLIAHSDGDVLIHALADAMLGAAALGDIGMHFPDTRRDTAGLSGDSLLRSVMGIMDAESMCLINMDATIIAQAPKIQPHTNAMRHSLAGIMGCSPQQVSIKATTNEQMGFIGRGEGIAVMVSVLMQQRVTAGSDCEYHR